MHPIRWTPSIVIPSPRWQTSRIHSAWMIWVSAALIILLLATTGCHRRDYRLWADHDASQILSVKQSNVDGAMDVSSVSPHPASRMADSNDPDCGPRPLDDPGVASDMLFPNGVDNSKYWLAIDESALIDDGAWFDMLPRNEQGELLISRETANQLALIHNREYQSQVESIYLQSLGLSASRFEFVTQWAGGGATDFSASGDAPTAARQLSKSTTLGFSRSFAAGGQFAASLVNSLSWELGSNHFSLGSGSLVFALTQPLLRGAFRHIRLEGLVQSERGLAYSIRNFAHFRRSFYLNITQSYLNLLAQTQSIRNQRANLKSLQLSLEEQQENASRGLVSQIDVDRIFQEYQSRKIGMLSSEQSYQGALDGFAFQLGLPSSVDLKIDESILQPFQLSDPRLDTLRVKIDELRISLNQFLPPNEQAPRELLDEVADEIIKIGNEVLEIWPSLQSDFDRWKQKLETGLRQEALEEERFDFTQQQDLAKRVGVRMRAIDEHLNRISEEFERVKRDSALQLPVDAWAGLNNALGNDCSEIVGEMFIVQTQIRLFLIEVKPYDTTEEDAVAVALSNRLDLMNQRAQVTDAFRAVELAADQLKGSMSVTAGATVGTDPNRSNSMRFDSSANSYRLGLQVDGPLNRMSERNSYRSAQINYQAARRSYMALEDSITNGIRSNLRSLRINWLNFQISRQQLIAASRSVEQAQLNLQHSKAATSAGSNLTRDLLDNLQGLLGAKDSLVRSWIAYEVARMQIEVDSEHLFLDENGVWINHDYNPAEAAKADSDR